MHFHERVGHTICRIRLAVLRVFRTTGEIGYSGIFRSAGEFDGLMISGSIPALPIVISALCELRRVGPRWIVTFIRLAFWRCCLTHTAVRAIGDADDEQHPRHFDQHFDRFGQCCVGVEAGETEFRRHHPLEEIARADVTGWHYNIGHDAEPAARQVYEARIEEPESSSAPRAWRQRSAP